MYDRLCAMISVDGFQTSTRLSQTLGGIPHTGYRRHPHHIHNANPQSGPMCLDASSEMLERGMLLIVHRLILTGQMSRQGLKREPMRQIAGATGQNEMLWWDESFNT
jgi:hypothetical protein